MTAFTENIFELFELTAKEKNISLNLHSNELNRISDVWLDHEKMEKVIANLLSNAIKYTEPVGTIDVQFHETTSTGKISISDTGIGISERQQQHIFDRFYQAESGDSRRSEGVGIGLALVKEFVELHGGEITIESQEGKGSCFTVILKKGRKHFTDKDFEISERVGHSIGENGNLSAENGITQAHRVKPANGKQKPEPDE
ncbi:sensor histidine kinase, partial [Gracilimonas sp.]|uniref:sensor histidine kinase n=1 Tax=Gracilimonas sp. TaxID=1974203 RepID=UPI003753A4C7